jgi:DNA-binding CsgD family transcriptional regulator
MPEYTFTIRLETSFEGDFDEVIHGFHNRMVIFTPKKDSDRYHDLLGTMYVIEQERKENNMPDFTGIEYKIIAAIEESPNADNRWLAYLLNMSYSSFRQHLGKIYDKLGLSGNGKAKRRALNEWIQEQK